MWGSSGQAEREAGLFLIYHAFRSDFKTVCFTHLIKLKFLKRNISKLL